MVFFAELKLLKGLFAKKCSFGKINRDTIRMSTRRPFRNEDWKGSFFLTTAGLAASCYVFDEATSKFLPFDKYWRRIIFEGTALATLMETTTTITTQMDYLEHDEKDYDIYIKNPTANDLPYLLNQFDQHGKEVWPWIWTHPNDAGPHYVFVGVNVDTLDQIRKLRSKSISYNILVIASEESLVQAANEAGDPNVYEETHCGIVTDATLELLNSEAKILMLSDERVISFDSLTII